ncbi:MAG: MFS transporter [Acidimicrobiales bacterium]
MVTSQFRSLRRHLYALAFANYLGPLYAMYTLLLNDSGISAAQISTVFLTWALVAIALEIPSGALADRMDRRHLIAAGYVSRAMGISIWLIWPTYTGVLAGTALWALHSASASGTWEAMVHDELTAVDEDHRYATVMARMGQLINVGVAVGAVMALLLLRLGVSLVFLGWATVVIHVASIALALTLPNVRWVAAGEHGHVPWSYRAWWGTLREGVAQAHRLPLLTKMIAIGALLEGLFFLDEYVPLIARDRGASNLIVPMVVLVVWLGLIAGGELAARRPNLSGHTLGTLLVVGTLAMFAALAADGVWALSLIGLGYVTLEVAWILSDARMQERTPAATRATVTSVRGFASGLVGAAAFALVGALAQGDDPTPGLFVVVAMFVVAGLLIYRWLPPSKAHLDEPRQEAVVATGVKLGD